TRGVDAMVVADRVARLSEVVAAAGVRDVAQGAELLAASDDLDVFSAAVGVMGIADLEQGMALARLSGELRVAAAIVSRLEMPVLATFLARRSMWVTRMGVQTVVRAGAARALSVAVAATGKDVAELSAEEVTEGIVRLAAAEAGAELSEE